MISILCEMYRLACLSTCILRNPHFWSKMLHFHSLLILGIPSGLSTDEAKVVPAVMATLEGKAYGSLNVEDADEEVGEKQQKIVEKYKLALIMCLVIILGPANFVLYKIMFEAYGSEGSFFVSNAVNLIYVLIGGVVLGIAEWKGEIDDEVRNTSHAKFMVMASCDGLAGFLAAMGAVYTSGAVQQLLNQTLIPFTMLMSFILLGKMSSAQHIIGAGVILLGVVVVLTPHIFGDDAEPTLRDSHTLILVSSIVYCLSNLPFAIAFVYKEFGFKDLNIHPIHLTQWVSVYQCIIGFLVMPLQMIPGFGSENGMTIEQSAKGMMMGWECFTQQSTRCQENRASLLLWTYCLVNFLYNLAGLYLVKHGSSILNAISGAIILPLTVISFTLPILGAYQEQFDWLTIVGLVVVLTGFIVWRSAGLMEIKLSSSGSSGSLLANIENGNTPPTSPKEQRAKKTPSSNERLRISFSPKITSIRSPLYEDRNKLSSATMTTIVSFQERVIPGGGLGGLED